MGLASSEEENFMEHGEYGWIKEKKSEFHYEEKEKIFHREER